LSYFFYFSIFCEIDVTVGICGFFRGHSNKFK
jgi:hypothetical protein